MKPFISIIVPVYGVEKYIGKCLTSLVEQTIDDFEIIVVNDGSKDNSQKIIDEFVKKYPTKIKSFIKENGGLGSARNYGISKAKGEYICFVDSDDYIEIDMLEKVAKKIKETKADIVMFENFLVDEFYRVIGKDKVKILDACNNNFKYLLLNNICVWNKVYKKSLIINNKIEFRSKIWYEDVDFTIKIMSKCKKVEVINEPFYNYLIRSGSIMNNSNIDRNLEILEAFDEIKKYNDYYDYIEFLAIDHIYISAVVRVLLADSKNSDKKRIINTLLDYMKENFPFYQKNKFLMYLSRNRKVIYWLLKLKLYGIVKLIFTIKNRGSLIWKKSKS